MRVAASRGAGSEFAPCDDDYAAWIAAEIRPQQRRHDETRLLRDREPLGHRRNHQEDGCREPACIK